MGDDGITEPRCEIWGIGYSIPSMRLRTRSEAP